MRVYKLIDAEFGLLALQQRRLKVSTIKDLNDPFEFLAVQQDDAYNRRAFRWFRNLADRTWGMLCFSQDWGDPMLWSYYGDKHRGMALGFDIPDRFATQVEYSDDRVVCRRTADGFPIEAIAKNHVTKFRHWAYEQEVRMFVGFHECEQQEAGLHFFPFGSELQLREVVLGPECALTPAEVLQAAGSHSGRGTLLKARLAFRSYRVVTQRLVKPKKF